DFQINCPLIDINSFGRRGLFGAVPMSEPHNITEVLEQVEEKTEGEARISIGEFLDTFEHRGYGPLLLIIALLIVLPTGGIPGIPTLLGLIIILIASQLAWGRSAPWLPKWLRKLGFKKG